MRPYVLHLFVTGRSPRSEAATENLMRVCDRELGDDVRVEIIDVLERPELAEEHRIVATPTLLKIEPAPARRIIGDLSDTETLMRGLDIRPSYDGEAAR